MKQIPVGSTFAVVDDCDYEELSQYKWSLNSRDGRNYANRIDCRCNRQKIYMHFLVADRAGLNRDGMEIDHRDGSGLNNCRANLRLATRAQNKANSRTPRNNTSGFKGVMWDKEQRKWRAMLRFAGKLLHLGRFTDKIEAARAYNEAAVKYFGEFARLNPV